VEVLVITYLAWPDSSGWQAAVAGASFQIGLAGSAKNAVVAAGRCVVDGQGQSWSYETVVSVGGVAAIG